MTHPSPVLPAVAPVGAWDRLAIVALGFAGCALSYDALQQMAVAIHVRGPLTYVFPLVVDGFIAYGVRALLVLSNAPLRARLYVWVLFGTATAASIWANALHAVRLNQQTTQTGLRLGDTVVAILSTLAPLALAGAVHLYILITRHHPADHGSAPVADQARGMRATGSADQTEEGAGPQDSDGRSAAGADQTVASARSLGRAADQTTVTATSAAADGADQVPASRTDRRSAPTPDRAAGHADQPTKVPGDDTGTSNDAGQPDDAPPDQTLDAGPDQSRAPETGADSSDASLPPSAEETAADEGASAPTADQDADVSESESPDVLTADQTTCATDHPGDADADQTTADDAPAPDQATSGGSPAADQRTTGADQDDRWEHILAVARKAALEEERMTRRALRPHLRKHQIRVSNENFTELQEHLLADPALAHLPRPARRVR
ncbi:DUF2637 domain-containing protein [Streptomyces cyaneofuscatus]|uniref:DUF2637 domain-containing protein n=1 Tax=Streptomyces cyaneofuscatus TaxID=66883 RepID=UPI0036B4639E